MRTHTLSPATMFLLWAWCLSFLPTYCTVACPNHRPSAPESPVMESLECRNDYMTHIHCSWTEIPGLPLFLFHLDPDEHRVSACVPVSTGPLTTQNASGQKRSQCRYNTSLFAIGFDDVFFFYMPHAQGLSGTMGITQDRNITEDWTHIHLVTKPNSPTLTQSMTNNLRPSKQPVDLKEDDRRTLTMMEKRRTDNRLIDMGSTVEPAAPIDMRVELIGDDWVLNWTLPKYRTVPITSELRYWSTTSPELAKTLSLPPGVSVCVMVEGSLRSSTSYLAQVRCSVSQRRGPGSRYAGYPSDRTKPVYWTTQPAPAPASAWVYFILSAIVTVVLILLYFILLAFCRRLRVWDASLPSPFHSKLMDAVCQFHTEKPLSHTEVDDPRLSRVCVLENIQLSLHAVNQEHDVTSLHAAHCDEPNHYASQDLSAVPPDITTKCGTVHYFQHVLLKTQDLNSYRAMADLLASPLPQIMHFSHALRDTSRSLCPDMTLLLQMSNMMLIF